MAINSTLEFKAALRSGSYAWPGGYPLFFICDDGGVLCCKCARSEVRNVMNAINDRKHGCRNTGWAVIGQDVNYENNNLYCDNCNKQIESACGE